MSNLKHDARVAGRVVDALNSGNLTKLDDDDLRVGRGTLRNIAMDLTRLGPQLDIASAFVFGMVDRIEDEAKRRGAGW